MSIKNIRIVLAILCALSLGYCGSTNNAAVDSTTTCSPKLVGGASTLCALSLAGRVTTVAGSGIGGSADGTGTSASFTVVTDVTTDGTNLYVVDSGNHRIRKIALATGLVTTLAGAGLGNADGVGTAATFNNPTGITTDGTNLYVADWLNHRIRKIVIATRGVTTLAGSSSGSADGIGTSATFNQPNNLTTDGTNLYVTTGDHKIRKIVIATAVVTTLAGSSVGSADGIGAAATFNNPLGITTDGANLYVVEPNNQRVRRIVIGTGVVTTLAGNAFGYADGVGSAAAFSNPSGITTDGTHLYISDTQNYRIRKLNISTRTVTTLVGSSQGYANGIGTAARFDNPWGLTTDGVKLYLADSSNLRIREIN